ncbi:CST complex subunit STN1 [Glycine soja]|uniref:CST complex subunit STN1 n=1 Tax=Glycine soja TaxID=3848 RepID=A0A0B2RTT5_GLYSO|nr:CST complex subunit STN1 [Glycine max]KHN35768.1 CST complex subunit STN1 [Glycine soja]
MEIMGTITLQELKHDWFLRFVMNDDIGCVPCLLWLNDANSLSVGLTTRFASLIKLGTVARVRGRLSCFRGAV